jgi:hypothetical protein
MRGLLAIVAALVCALGLLVIRPAIPVRAASPSQKDKSGSPADASRKKGGAAPYIPRAQYCVTTPVGPQTLCSVIPGNIGPDPMLDHTVAYNGIIGPPPTSANTDVQTPFDNLSWQTFVALNWTLGKENQPAEQGLKGDGRRVWEGWPRVAEVFGNGKVQANCGTPPPGVMVFSIASNGLGQPVGQNEEYIQAATGDPLIDVSGNWTIYERRINNLEVAYLRAPDGKPSWTLTTMQGQTNLVNQGGTVDFPSAGPKGVPPTGAIEIKAAWRILDPAKREQNKKKYYVVPALLKVAPDLVSQKTPVCAVVDMGLVAMHIIQKNPKTKNALKPEWFWSTFEHVDNAPIAKNACNPADPSACTWFGNLNCTPDPTKLTSHYSYFNLDCRGCQVNKSPQASTSNPEFAWNSTQPFAKSYLGPPGSGGGTQVSRCWAVYSVTAELNRQWRGKLAQAGSVFQNYMLVGTQWGASITSTPDPKVPHDAVPSYLSNTVVETYLQTLYNPNDAFGTGSCVSCHTAAVLPAKPKVSSNLSFLPFLAKHDLVRQKLDKMMEQLKQEAERAQ